MQPCRLKEKKNVGKNVLGTVLYSLYTADLQTESYIFADDKRPFFCNADYLIHGCHLEVSGSASVTRHIVLGNPLSPHSAEKLGL